MLGPVRVSPYSDEQTRTIEQGQAGIHPQEQQDGGFQHSASESDRLSQRTTDQSFRAVWDARSVPNTTHSQTYATDGASSARSQGSSHSSKKTGSRVGFKQHGSQRNEGENKTTQNASGSMSTKKRTLSEAQPLETISDALDYCNSLVSMQIERAKETHVAMNESIHGDERARKSMFTLLPNQYIREVFLNVIRTNDALPRIRPLFGAPPYSFLLPEDAGLVRSGGFAPSRVNMTYDKSNMTANYSQFGLPQLVDSYMREYRIVAFGKVEKGDSLLFNFDAHYSSKPLRMDVRVPKRSRQERVKMLKDASLRKAIVFPNVGETVVLQYSNSLQQVWGVRAHASPTFQVVVRSLTPRSTNGTTATIVATML